MLEKNCFWKSQTALDEMYLISKLQMKSNGEKNCFSFAIEK